MAKKNNNEDPEEEKDDQFDDDEDFGLPDLEYEELDDDEADGDREDIKETETPSPTEPVGEADEAESGGIEIDETETEDWERELEKELDEELKSGEPVGYYEEESYEELESTGESESIENSVFSSDKPSEPDPTPKAPEPVKTTRPGFVPPPRYAKNTYDVDNSKGNFARTVVIGTLAFALIAILFFFLYEGDNEKEPVVQKVEQKAPPKKVEEAKPVVETPAEPEPEPPARNTQANAVTPGEITTLEQQTGKTYVIIGSFFDGDQANDFAQKLAKDGKSPMIIPPFRDYRFYRVSVAEFNSFKDAQANLDSYKSEYGEDIWPLRY